MKEPTIEDKLRDLMYMSSDDLPKAIWINNHTLTCLKRDLPRHEAHTMGLAQQFSGIPVKIDNTISDFSFETDDQRNDRIKELMRSFVLAVKYSGEPIFITTPQP